jgi:hypothetical protein
MAKAIRPTQILDAYMDNERNLLGDCTIYIRHHNKIGRVPYKYPRRTCGHSRIIQGKRDGISTGLKVEGFLEKTSDV